MSREQPTLAERTGAGLRTAAVAGGLFVGMDAASNVFRNTFQKAGRSIISPGTWKWAAGAALVVGAFNFIFRKSTTSTIDQRQEARNQSQIPAAPAEAESTRYRDMIARQRSAAQAQGVNR